MNFNFISFNSTFQILNSIFLFIVGAGVGSFLNMLIDRLPREEGIMGRSHCDSCRHQLAWYDLIPIVSYISLAGRCRYCRKKIPFRNTLVEVVTGTSFVGIWNMEYRIWNIEFGIGYKNLVSAFINSKFNILNSIFLLAIISMLIVIFFIDLKHQIIPDSLQVAFFIFSFIIKSAEILQMDCVGNQWLYCYIVKLLYCFGEGLIVMLPILLLWLLTRGRGMGFGDVKLAFNIGFLLGWQGGLLALYIAFIVGALVSVVLILLGKKKLKSKIAFGPFLVIGIVVMLFYQQPILNFIRGIYGF